MRFTFDRCIACGIPGNTWEKLRFNSPYDELSDAGRFKETDFWFCSIKCYEDALDTYIPRQFQFQKKIEDDPEYKAFRDKTIKESAKASVELADSRGIEELSDEEFFQFFQPYQAKINHWEKVWHEYKAGWIQHAQAKLRDRLYAEDKVIRTEQKEKSDKRDAKYEAAIAKQEAEQAAKDAERLAQEPQPFEMPPDSVRFSGTWCIAPQGKGKTTLLHHLVLSDAVRDVTVILMDSKGDLIDPIRKIIHPEHLVVLEPHADYPLALNPLRIGATTTHTISFIEHLFTSLLETKATPMQALLFRCVLIALQKVPDASFATFRDFLVKGWRPYEQYIRLLHPEDQTFFFGGEFDSKMYADRRQEILWRIRDLTTKIPILRDTFSSPTTKIDMAALMDSGKVVIINVSKKLLADEGTEFLGRFFIAMVRAAADQRPIKGSKPVFFYIDECQNIIRRDEKIASIIDECRSKNIGLILAHQRADQIESENVLSALGNCAIRYANSDDDAKYLADKLRTTPEFLRSLPRGVFAAYVRDAGATKALQVPFNDLSEYVQTPPDQQKAHTALMRHQYSFQPVHTIHETPKAPEKRAGSVAESVETPRSATPPNQPIVPQKNIDPSKPAPSLVKADPKPAAAKPTADPTDAGDAASEW